MLELTRTGPRSNPKRSSRAVAGSLALASGATVVTVQKLLGHKTPLVTLSIYSHMLPDDFDKRSGALMIDGRRTLGDISRAVNNLDRNPTRLLFGAGNSNAAPAEAVAKPAPAAGEKRKP